MPKLKRQKTLSSFSSFLLFSFTSQNVADKLIERYNAGFLVSGVVEKQRVNMQYEKARFLKENGISVKADTNKYLLHDKVFIINNEILVLGSYNPTSAGNTKNDENLLIIYNKELANKMGSRFNEIYSKPEDF